MASPAGAHTWCHSAPQWWSRVGGTAHNSRLLPSPPSPVLGRLVEEPDEADGLNRPALPCWLQREEEAVHRGQGYQPATAPSWLLCTSGCELFCSETTPGQERKKK